jgi:hypothetical protein
VAIVVTLKGVLNNIMIQIISFPKQLKDSKDLGNLPGLWNVKTAEIP